MNRTRQTFAIAFILIAFSLGTVAYRHIEHGLPFTPPKNNNSWTIEARLFFNAADKPAKVNFFLPQDNKKFTIVDEQFITQNYTTSVGMDKQTNNRQAIFENPLASGQQVILYRVTVELEKELEENARVHIIPESDDKKLLPPQISHKKPEIQAINHREFNRSVLNLITHARENSADNRELVTNAIAVLKDKSNELTTKIYEQLQPETSSYFLLEYVLHQAQLPYRKVHGFTINKDNKSFPFREWIDVFLDGEWVQIGSNGKLNENEDAEQFRWWNGDLPIIKVEGGTHADIDIYYKENFSSQTAKAIDKGAPANIEWVKYPFAKLPISTQKALEVLLLMPLGALIIAFCRQVIGISTYGTFMPILLAIAFREITPTWSLVMFACIISFGLIARALIDHLQLLMVPKLSAIMTAMIIGIIGFSLVSREVDIRATFSIGLLPIVILAMLIERITINWDQYGYKDTLISGIGSLFVTYLCYLVLNQGLVSHIIFNFPEIILSVLGVILLIGRYRGYKVFELVRFKYFLRDEEKI